MANETQENISPVWLAVLFAMKELCSLHGRLVIDGEAPEEKFTNDNSEGIRLLYEAVRNLSHALGYAEYELDTSQGLILLNEKEHFKIDTSKTSALIRKAILILNDFCKANDSDFVKTFSFTDYEKMSPVQLALTHARRELSFFNGLWFADNEKLTKAVHVDNSMTIKLIDDALRTLDKSDSTNIEDCL